MAGLSSYCPPVGLFKRPPPTSLPNFREICYYILVIKHRKKRPKQLRRTWPSTRKIHYGPDTCTIQVLPPDGRARGKHFTKDPKKVTCKQCKRKLLVRKYRSAYAKGILYSTHYVPRGATQTFCGRRKTPSGLWEGWKKKTSIPAKVDCLRCLARMNS